MSITASYPSSPSHDLSFNRPALAPSRKLKRKRSEEFCKRKNDEDDMAFASQIRTNEETRKSRRSQQPTQRLLNSYSYQNSSFTLNTKLDGKQVTAVKREGPITSDDVKQDPSPITKERTPEPVVKLLPAPLIEDIVEAHEPRGFKTKSPVIKGRPKSQSQSPEQYTTMHKRPGFGTPTPTSQLKVITPEPQQPAPSSPPSTTSDVSRESSPMSITPDRRHVIRWRNPYTHKECVIDDISYLPLNLMYDRSGKVLSDRERKKRIQPLLDDDIRLLRGTTRL